MFHCRKKRYDGIGLRKKYGIEGKCIAIFGGNLGIAQQPENILELAKLHQDKSDLIFIIIGKGTKAAKMSDQIDEQIFSNSDNRFANSSVTIFGSKEPKRILWIPSISCTCSIKCSRSSSMSMP